MKKILVTLFIIALITSCKTNKPDYFNISFLFSDKIENIKPGDNLPSLIYEILNYYEIKDDTSPCYEKLFAPEKIVFVRTDLNMQKDFGIPLKWDAKLSKSTNMLSIKKLKIGYHPINIKTPKLLIRKKGDKNFSFKSNGITFKISLNANKKEIEELRKQIEKKLCEGANNIYVRLIQDSPETGPEIVIDDKKKGGEEVKVEEENNNVHKVVKTTVVKTTRSTKVHIINDNSTWVKHSSRTYSSSYAKYEGGIEKGKADGIGTLIFKKNHLIPVPKNSEKKIWAKKGDKLSGRFNKGNFVSGKLYDKNGKKKQTIFIGR